jgi:hypothetical protein
MSRVLISTNDFCDRGKRQICAYGNGRAHAYNHDQEGCQERTSTNPGQADQGSYEKTKTY